MSLDILPGAPPSPGASPSGAPAGAGQAAGPPADLAAAFAALLAQSAGAPAPSLTAQAAAPGTSPGVQRRSPKPDDDSDAARREADPTVPTAADPVQLALHAALAAQALPPAPPTQLKPAPPPTADSLAGTRETMDTAPVLPPDQTGPAGTSTASGGELFSVTTAQTTPASLVPTAVPVATTLPGRSAALAADAGETRLAAGATAQSEGQPAGTAGATLAAAPPSLAPAAPSAASSTPPSVTAAQAAPAIGATVLAARPTFAHTSSSSGKADVSSGPGQSGPALSPGLPASVVGTEGVAPVLPVASAPSSDRTTGEGASADDSAAAASVPQGVARSIPAAQKDLKNPVAPANNTGQKPGDRLPVAAIAPQTSSPKASSSPAAAGATPQAGRSDDAPQVAPDAGAPGVLPAIAPAVTLASPTSTGPPAPDRAQAAQQVTTQVRVLGVRTAGGGQGQMTLQLHPKEWGQVSLTVTTTRTALPDGTLAPKVVAHVTAETPAVKAALEAHADDLRRALHDSGLRLDSLTVTVQSAAASTQAGASGQERREGQPQANAWGQQSPSGAAPQGGGAGPGNGQSSSAAFTGGDGRPQGQPRPQTAYYSAAPQVPDDGTTGLPLATASGRLDTRA